MSAIKLFESKKIRSVWDSLEEKWYFSVVDVVGALTDVLIQRTTGIESKNAKRFPASSYRQSVDN